MPSRAGGWPELLDPVGKVRAELAAPAPDGFVADHHAALKQQFLDLPQA
jgi:hypothetical protein